MILSSLIGAALLGQAATQVVCPIMGSRVPANAPFDDFNGVRFAYCCPGCDAKFARNPLASLKSANDKKWVIGKSLFDPVARTRVWENRSKGFSDYKGVRFYFTTEANKATFDASPAKFGELPTKESLVCPVTEEKIGGYQNASDYVDFDGVRYYICCAGCLPKMEADPAKYAKAASKHVKAPGIANPSKNSGH